MCSPLLVCWSSWSQFGGLFEYATESKIARRAMNEVGVRDATTLG
jgi:hypothetical protein